MAGKSFDELAITDDYIFCNVMQDIFLCKRLVTLVLNNRIGNIVKLVHQKLINNYISAKSVRFDIMVKDETGCMYDVEMQTTNQRNLEKRMRYYQSAIDDSTIDKGADYKDLPNTFIIFFCTFDYLDKGMPLYTIQPTCNETNTLFQDGTVKIIVNSRAAERAEGELRVFLNYMNGKPPESDFTKQIEKMVNKIKANEQKRREYMLIQSFEMDARRSGIQQGIQQGKSLGLTEGLHQKALEAAKTMLQLQYPMEDICKITGLSVDEVESL